MNLQFAEEIIEGLSSTPKQLSSKWFYDKIGDGLFVKIMNMPEYYLTDAEYEIFSKQTSAILDEFEVNKSQLELYELGAGDGTKTIQLLKAMDPKNFTYHPIDISENALNQLQERLAKELPEVSVAPVQGEYFEVLESLSKNESKIILFLGSNLGNMHDDVAKQFIKQLAEQMQAGDKLLLGLDKMKSKAIILPAYNDKQGYTEAFNLNLLSRINSEFDADFNLAQFEHRPNYDEETGIASSALVSKCRQTVNIKSLDKTFEFEENESIQTEISRKYNLDILENVFAGSGLAIKKEFNDSRNYFMNVLLEKN